MRAYYEKVFRPDLTTMVVIGKVTPEQAKSAMEKYFGEWKATGPKPETDLPPVPRNEPKTTLIPDRSRVQDDVTLGQTFGLRARTPTITPFNSACTFFREVSMLLGCIAT